jgi:hypothetical protein
MLYESMTNVWPMVALLSLDMRSKYTRSETKTSVLVGQYLRRQSNGNVVQVKVHDQLKLDDLRRETRGRRPGQQIDTDLEGVGSG